MPRRLRHPLRPLAITLGIVSAALLIYVAAMLLILQPFRNADGLFDAADYPRLYRDRAWARYGLPPALPAAASGVVIFVHSAQAAFMPPTDEHIEVRFLLPPADSAALLSAALASQPSRDGTGFDTIINGLGTADDRDPSTPLPKTFQHALVRNTSTHGSCFVSIDPDKGEVVYWYFEP